MGPKLHKAYAVTEPVHLKVVSQLERLHDLHVLPYYPGKKTTGRQSFQKNNRGFGGLFPGNSLEHCSWKSTG